MKNNWHPFDISIRIENPKGELRLNIGGVRYAPNSADADVLFGYELWVSFFFSLSFFFLFFPFPPFSCMCLVVDSLSVLLLYYAIDVNRKMPNRALTYEGWIFLGQETHVRLLTFVCVAC